MDVRNVTFKNSKCLYLSLTLRLKMRKMLVYGIKIQTEADTF